MSGINIGTNGYVHILFAGHPFDSQQPKCGKGRRTQVPLPTDEVQY